VTTSTSSEQTATVWPLAFAGALLVWLAQPPFAWHWLAWGSLAPWSLLAIRQHRLGRRGWWWLWLAAATSWLVSLQGIRLANPAIYPAWFALAGYLGIYPVLAVGLSRVIHHGWKIPVWIAFPSVWAGLELIRGYVITGFSGMLLGHTQADVPIVTQIADIGGTYYVSFVVAMASAVLASFLNVLTSRGTTSHAVTKKFSKPTILGAAAFATVLIATLVYGQFRLSQADRLAQAEPLLEALLIQRDEPLEFVLDPGKEAAVFGRYVESTLQAAARWPKADLIVWPESMFNGGFPYRILKDKFMVPEGTLHPDEPRELTNDEFANLIRIQGSIFEQRADEIRTMIAMQAGVTDAPELLVGCAVYEYGEIPRSYGAALHIDRASKVAAWYAKIHLVMFGEYIPFGSYFPWLYEIGPLRQGATPGSAPVSMEIAGVQIAPNICFETVVEHSSPSSSKRTRPAINYQPNQRRLVSRNGDPYASSSRIAIGCDRQSASLIDDGEPGTDNVDRQQRSPNRNACLSNQSSPGRSTDSRLTHQRLCELW
jgi:apolipoprotein N-acyltransferase